jgi:major vault protein
VFCGKITTHQIVMAVVTIPSLFYCHIFDGNTNIVRVEVGPLRYTLQSEESLECKPTPFLTVPPNHYISITHPVVNKFSLPHRNRYDCTEYRFNVDPFPLYPGEKAGQIRPLHVIPAGCGLHLRAIADERDGDGIFRNAGEEWIVEGLKTYYPREAEMIVREVSPRVITEGKALHLTASSNFVDRFGIHRISGEQWMISTPGSYLLHMYEVVREVEGFILTPQKAIYVQAQTKFVDQNKITHNAGEVWLVSHLQCEYYLPSPEVTVVGVVKAIQLTEYEYCYIQNPYNPETKKQRLGALVLCRGPRTFFLYPNEKLHFRGDLYSLEGEDALLLSATEDFDDLSENSDTPIKRQAGSRWMVRGPCLYCPQIQVHVIERRRTIPLSETEGIYVKNLRTGEIRSEMGVQCYLLKPYEELWAKPMTFEMAEILRGGGAIGGQDVRKLQYFTDYAIQTSYFTDRTRIVSFAAPASTAVQVVDLKTRNSRVIFGPSLVLLQPFEEFTVFRYSAGKPKRPNALVSICLLLGPDIITDIFEVETEDHARVRLKLASNYHFEFDQNCPSDVNKLFSMSDFIGDASKMIASRVRATVARTQFEVFHKNSATIITDAVFGKSSSFKFDCNNLVISSIDVQEVNVIDEKARNLLYKSVQIAIDITTKKLETTASHDAKVLEQEAEGRIKIERIQHEAEAEKARAELVIAKLENSKIEKDGRLSVVAKSEAEMMKIEGETMVEKAKARAMALDIIHEREENVLKRKREIEYEFRKKELELELEREAQLSAIQSHSFCSTVAAIGSLNLQEMAKSQIEAKANMLANLGLEGILVSNGRTPVNLIKTAEGMIGYQ